MNHETAPLKTALVLGATGGLGGEMARRLASRGWQVRALHRHPESLPRNDALTWLRGDAMSADDVAQAAEGASLIVHGVNPPGYRHWSRLALPMLDNSIAAARPGRARLLLPGNLYNYGPDAFASLDETAPQHPHTAKGKVRVEMERRLRQAAEAGDIQALVVRAGDFFGPRARNNWFGQVLVKPGGTPRAITSPGRPGVGHQWAYLPDVAETMLRLLERADPAPFATFHMQGHWDADGGQMVAAIRRALGAPALPVKHLPWTAMRLASPLVPLFRELIEMKYLWDQPLRMGNARLLRALGEEPHTALDTAVRSTLIGLGCLTQQAQPAAPTR